MPARRPVPGASARRLKTWAVVHKWTSLACTAFVLLLCLTGLPLIFHDELDDLFAPDIKAPVMAPDTPKAPLDRVIAAAQQRYPHQVVQLMFVSPDDPNLIDVAMAAKPKARSSQIHRVVVDARTAQVLGDSKPDRGPSAFLLALHSEILMGPIGYGVLCVVAVLFIVAIVSGVVLYQPFMRKLAFGTVRQGRTARTRWLDLHNLLGIVTASWALVVGATGVMNTLADPLFGTWQAHELAQMLAPDRGKPPPKTLSSIQAAFDVAQKAESGLRPVSALYPAARQGSSRHYLIWTKGKSPLTARLFTPVLVDASTGALTQAQGLPWYLRALEVSRPLHFGDYGGLPLKILWALLDLVTIGVLGSGLYLWVSKRGSSAGGQPDEVQAIEAELGLAPIRSAAE